jgi:PAS domain S-box-containing protein
MAGPSILVVEDEGIVARDIQHRLESIGYRVPEIAATGKDAITRALDLKPDVVLMDIMLKGPMDGIEAAAFIREKLDVPVVYVTAYAEEEVLKRARVTEPYGYIVKPFEDRELQAAVEIALYRHRAERRMAESEKRYRTLVTSLQEGIMMTDVEENIAYANPALCEMLGYREDQLVRMNLGDLVPEEDIEKIREATKDRQQGRRGWCDIRMTRSGGELRSIQLSPAPWTNEMGQFMGVISTLVDITDPKVHESRLKASDARYRLLAENAADVIWTMDHNRCLTYVSPSVGRLLGYSPAEMTTMRMKDYLSVPSLEMLTDALEHMARSPGEGRAPVVLELDHIRQDGKSVPTEVVLTPIAGDGKAPSGVLGVTRDISARRRAEDELMERTVFLEEVIDTASDGLFVVNAKGESVLISATARDILGDGLEEWIGHLSGNEGADRERFDRVIDGEQISFESELKSPSDQKRSIRVTLTPMRYGGKPHVLGILNTKD